MYDELIKRLKYNAGWDESGDLKEAADAIEELQGKHFLMKKTAEWLAEKVPAWVSVADRLPSAHELVLVYNPGYLMSTGFMYEDGRWRVRSVDYPETPTHWMPLPEPPEELTGTDMRGGIRWDEAGNVIDWGITGPPGDVGKTEEGE